jgi:hypothetical protein
MRHCITLDFLIVLRPNKLSDDLSQAVRACIRALVLGTAVAGQKSGVKS